MAPEMTMRLVRLALTTALVAIAAAPAAAFDALEEMLVRLPRSPAGVAGTGEWYFIAPDRLLTTPLPAWPGVGYDGLTTVLVNPAMGLFTVGIDFTALEGILSYGAPPDTILYLAGDGIEPEAVGTVLLEREGMTRSDIGGFPVFSVGEDNGLYLDGMQADYPFATSGARAHRVAVTGGAAMVTNATPLMVEAVDAFIALPSAPLAEIAAAAEMAAPQGLEAFGAAGINRRMLFGDAGDAAPYYYALFVASSGDGGEAMQAVLLLPTMASAETVVPPIVERLQAFHGDTGGKIVWSVAPTATGPVAIITLAFPPGTEGSPAANAYRDWVNSIFRLDGLFVEIP
jgi:hypothetical protein